MEKLIPYIKQVFPKEWSITTTGEGGITIRDQAVDRGRGYIVVISEFTMYYSVTIRFEDFASDLMVYSERQLSREESLIRRLLKNENNLSCRLYRQSVEVDFDPDSVRQDGWWLDILYKKKQDASLYGEDFINLLLTLILLLFPYDAEAEEEGAPESLLLTKYERSRVNRASCLAFHGYSCKACGENMRDKYGEAARSFIHVHHLNPVSEAGAAVPDPVNDMVPLCPNCHGVAHRRNPPYTVEEIQNMLKQNHVGLHP